MGRPPQNGGPAFRFTSNEVAEMETCWQESNHSVPSREVIDSLAEKFSASPDRAGKITVQTKQVWNWFQNRRYAQKTKVVKPPGKLSVSGLPRDDSVLMTRRNSLDTPNQEFEAKSARDGAWYDVASFVGHRMFDTGDPEVRVRFSGFGAEEDEWVNVRKHVRQRSLPCEASECVAVLNGDLVLCFQEGKDQALYFDAHVLDAQRRRHDVRGCRCRFLVRYVHDQSEEIVPLRKVCRRPETHYRFQLLHASKETVEQKNTGNTPRVVSSLAEKTGKPCKLEIKSDDLGTMTPQPSNVTEPTTSEKETAMEKDEKPIITGAPDAKVGDAASSPGSVSTTDMEVGS